MATVSSPVVANFRRRRTTFDVDVEKLMKTARNGLRQHILVDRPSVTEERYQRWLRKTGFNGTNQGTRPEAAVFMELERLGYRSPLSEPPGMDFEFAPLNPLLDDFDLWFTNPPTIIRVQGEFFHYSDAEQVSKDEFQRVQAENMGFIVVDLLAQDTLNRGRLEEVVALAIMGGQLSEDGRLQFFR